MAPEAVKADPMAPSLEKAGVPVPVVFSPAGAFCAASELS